jgi:BMFP domain-containing protein YqiC
MINKKQIDELVQKLYSSLPSSLQNLENEVQQKFSAILQTTFNHLDLVTREEFDVQTKVLAKTRSKVEELSKQLAQLQVTTSIKN